MCANYSVKRIDAFVNPINITIGTGYYNILIHIEIFYRVIEPLCSTQYYFHVTTIPAVKLNICVVRTVI